MATWKELLKYVRHEYQVIREDEDEIRILFEFEDERSQVMVIQREVLDEKYEWVQIASPCGVVANLDLKAVLEEIGNTTICCGAAIMGEHLVVRHSLPLENLDLNEFEDPLVLLAGTADRLEEMFTGGDEY
ncbi:hypothetical protein D5S17_17255 [Pseudonocardiaceae bacterium YIM PH 21723]|nr:hypothetical protein D5S17_17255 [Pseudonocardiaceae bacterium YIM PH 21723]